MSKYYVEMSIKELRAHIEWRKKEMKRLYRDWNTLADADLGKYEQYQQEIKDAVNEIDRRKGGVKC